jgi:hypothetical protein
MTVKEFKDIISNMPQSDDCYGIYDNWEIDFSRLLKSPLPYHHDHSFEF